MSSTTTTTTKAPAVPSSVQTTINYFPEEGGTRVYTPGSAAFYKRKFTPTNVDVEDIRGREADFTLTKQGFQLVNHKTEQGDFNDEARIKAFYFKETEKLIQQVTGATKVKTFSHEVRKVGLNSVLSVAADEKTKDDHIFYKSPPAMYAHIDNSPEWSRILFQRILGAEEAERLRGCRWAIINAWRPVKPVSRDPLGLVDAATVEDEDLVSVYARATAAWGNSVKDFTGQQAEIFNVKSNPKHHWYYASSMRPDEILLFVNFDTKKSEDGHRLRVVHSAFPHEQEDGAPPRESIELRTVVVWEDQPGEEK